MKTTLLGVAPLLGCLNSLKKSPTHALASSQQFQAIFLEGRELTGKNRPQRPLEAWLAYSSGRTHEPSASGPGGPPVPGPVAPATAGVCSQTPASPTARRPNPPLRRGGTVQAARPRGPRSGRQWASRGGGGGGEQEVTAWEPEAGLGRRFGRGGHLAAEEEAFPRGPPCTRLRWP